MPLAGAALGAASGTLSGYLADRQAAADRPAGRAVGTVGRNAGPYRIVTRHSPAAPCPVGSALKKSFCGTRFY